MLIKVEKVSIYFFDISAESVGTLNNNCNVVGFHFIISKNLFYILSPIIADI